MAISAKRFQFLDEETNVALADFQDPSSSDIFNSPNNQQDEMTADMQDFIENAAESASLPSMNAATDEILRKSKELSSSIRDLTGLSSKQIEALTASIFPNNPLAKNAFGQLAQRCRDGALGNGGFGRPFDPTIDCNGSRQAAGRMGCTSSQFGNLLDKLTNGQYSALFNDSNGLLLALLSLSALGYNLNMCGVFGALSNNLSSDILSRGAAGLLNMLGSGGNVLGALDIAKNVSLKGLYPSLENPGAVGTIMTGFRMPGDLVENDYPGFTDGFQGGMDSIDDSWMTSSHDGILSSSTISSSNGDRALMYQCRQMDNIFTEANYNQIPSSDFDFFAASARETSSFDELSFA